MTTLPVINLSTYGDFASDNVLNWDDYYDDASPNISYYASRNDTVANATMHSFSSGGGFPWVDELEDFISLPLEFAVPVGGNSSVNVTILDGRTGSIWYNDTSDFTFTQMYHFSPSVVREFYMLSLVLFPLCSFFLPPSWAFFWDYIDIYIYITGVDGVARGWRLNNNHSASVDDYRSVTIDTGEGLVSAEIYDVEITFPGTPPDFDNPFNVRPIDIDRVIPYFPRDLSFLGLPSIGEILEAFPIDKLPYVIDQYYGWYQHDIFTADGIGFTINIHEGFNTTHLREVYENSTFFAGSPVTIRAMFGENDSYLFRTMELNTFLGYILTIEQSVTQVLMFDLLVVLLAASVIIVLNYYPFPGRVKFDEERRNKCVENRV